MIQKPGHLQFDDSVPERATPRSPKALDFGAEPDEKAAHSPDSPQRHAPKPREPAPLFGDGGGSVAQAMDYARSTFPEMSKTQAHSIERKIRQLTPWNHEVISIWGSKALDENAAITLKAAHLINCYSEYGINELVDKALSVSRRGESGMWNRLFLRRKIISYKPALNVARSQLAQLIGDCSNCISSLEPLNIQLKSSLVALVSAHETMPKPADTSVESTIHARRLLLQQAIHQSELTSLQLQELKQQMAVRLTHAEQLLTITIPAFEIADAAR